MNTRSLPVFDTISEAWQKVKGAKATFFVAFILSTISNGISNYFHQQAEQGNIVTFIIYAIVIVLVMTIGAGVNYLGLLRGKYDQEISWKQIFRPFKRDIFFKNIGAGLIFLLIGFVAGLVLGLTTALSNLPIPFMPLIAHLASLAIIIYTLYLFVRFMLTFYYILDTLAGPIEAMKHSYHATRGFIWNIVGIMLVTIFLMIISAIPLGIGLIWTFPLACITGGLVYKKLSANS